MVLVSLITVAGNDELLVGSSRGVGEMLADEGVVEAEPVGQDGCLAILAPRLRPVAAWMHRHGEVTQPHLSALSPVPVGTPTGAPMFKTTRSVRRINCHANVNFDGAKISTYAARRDRPSGAFRVVASSGS